MEVEVYRVGHGPSSLRRVVSNPKFGQMLEKALAAMEHHLTEEVSHVEHEFARGWNAEGRRIRRLRRQTRGSGPATVPIHFDPIGPLHLQPHPTSRPAPSTNSHDDTHNTHHHEHDDDDDDEEEEHHLPTNPMHSAPSHEHPYNPMQHEEASSTTETEASTSSEAATHRPYLTQKKTYVVPRLVGRENGKYMYDICVDVPYKGRSSTVGRMTLFALRAVYSVDVARVSNLSRRFRMSTDSTHRHVTMAINLSLLQGQRIRIFSAVPLGTAARIDQYDARGLIPWLDRPRCSSSSPVDTHPGTHGHGGLHHPDTAAPAWNETFSHHMLSVLVSVGFPLMVVAIVFLLAAAVTACIRRRTNRAAAAAAAATTGRPSPPASSRPAPAAASFAHAPPPPPLYGYVAVNQQGQSPSLYY